VLISGFPYVRRRFHPSTLQLETLHMTSSAGTLAVAPTWGLIPPLGNLESYITAVHRLPMLTLEQEQDYARRLKDESDVEAAGRLVMSHLRVVVAVSRQYLGYGIAHADLIQEGNIGLMKAVRRFDPSQGVRLVSYALHWIKAEIHEYIIKNWRMVKVATTKAQRKLFFNLRSMKQGMQKDAAMDDALAGQGLKERLSPAQIGHMARELNVKPEEVREMEMRLGGGDVLLDPTPSDDGEAAFGPISYLRDDVHEPTAVLDARERDAIASDGLTQALAVLDDRSRRVVQERWLKVNDDGSGGMTLHELAAEYGVSAERIRQIEVAAMKKMRTALAAFA
jgi:RNA polymerase sigma-32 factor